MDLTKEKRDRLLSQIRELTRQQDEEDLTILQLRALEKEIQEKKRTYALNLPETGISRCPFTGEPFSIRMDIYGLDGPFWDIGGTDVVTQASPHFLTYTGALNFRSKVPPAAETGLENEIRTGCEVPYVITRLMNLSGMKCVISADPEIFGKYSAFYMTYFCDPPRDQSEGHQFWLRQRYHYRKDGHEFWGMRTDPWDFDLRNWIDTERAGWIPPGDLSLTIRWGTKNCPYLEIKGRRRQITLRRGRILEAALPDGTAVEYGD